MKRTAVSSSMVKSIGYDKISKTVEVEFSNGSIGQYLNVPAEKHKEFLNADSHGKFVHQELKPNFTFQKIK